MKRRFPESATLAETIEFSADKKSARFFFFVLDEVNYFLRNREEV